MKTLLIATQNQGKIKEIRKILSEVPYTLIGLDQLPGYSQKSFAVDETGDTFEANALLKAKTIGLKTNLLTLADDSGLVVDALSGRPGVYSHRYGPTDELRNQKLLTELAGVLMPQRTARFVCVAALSDPSNHQHFTFEGVVEGFIAQKPSGSHGFGYDPVFFSTELNQTFAQASILEKNKVSHRARAFTKLSQFLKTY